jgi:hypothetical protein
MLTYIKADSDSAAAFDSDEVIVLVGAFNKAWQTILASGVQLDEDSEPVSTPRFPRVFNSIQTRFSGWDKIKPNRGA